MPETLRLTPITLDDSAALFALVAQNRAYLRRWLPWLDGTRQEADSRQFLAHALEEEQQGRALHRLIRVQGQVIGIISVREIAARQGTVGYWLAQSHAGRGLMRAACRQLLALCRAQGQLDQLLLCAAEGNLASIAVARACGFVYQTRLAEAETLYGATHDLLQFVLPLTPSAS